MTQRSDASMDLPCVDWSRFAGLEAPAYTQIPDDLLDWVMPYLTGAELKVLLYIARRTFGFKKATDAISIEQLCNGIITHDGRRLDLGTGLKRSTILEALRSLRAKNLVVAEQQLDGATGSRPTVYALHMRQTRSQGDSETFPTIITDPGYARADPRVCQSRPPGMPEQTPGYARADPGGMLEQTPEYARADPQKTVKQKTVKQKRVNSNSSKSIPIVRDVECHEPTPLTEGMPSVSDEIMQVIGGYSILFHDRVHERSNCTRAQRIWESSGLAEGDFVALLHEARKITQKRGNIARAATDGSPEGTKNRMPYYFRVVEDLIAIVRADRADDRLAAAALSATGD